MKTTSHLTRKLVLLFLMFATPAISQSITNTLGTNGIFAIKDATSNYLTLSQTTGQVNILRTLRLENTANSTTGVMFKGAERFLHNYGSGNTFLGVNSGSFTMNTGVADYNTGIGKSTLSNLTTGYYNTAVGGNSLLSNTTGIYNTALGKNSLYNNTNGEYNTALGTNSLMSNTTGRLNLAAGILSLYSNTNGEYNTALGSNSLRSNTGGTNNTAVGYQSLNSNVSGFNNTALGNNSLFNNTGNYNTAIGFNAGSTITSGANLTCLGIDAAPSSATALDQVTLGNGFVQSLRCNVQTISSLSDARDKKNITDLTLGLDFLMKVKPRQFNWDKREWYEGNSSDGSKMKETLTAGFISQELDEAQTNENADWLNLVLKDNPEKLEATYGNLLPVMVKAIQELKAENDKLKVKNEKPNVEIEKLKIESENSKMEITQLKFENKEMRQNNKKLASDAEALKSMNEKIVKLEKMINELTSEKQASHNSRIKNLANSKSGEEK